MLTMRFAIGMSLVSVLAILAGCSKKSQETSAPPSNEMGKPAAVADKSESELPQGLKGLSPEDLALVQKQKVCPVSGESLGTMGKPFKTTLKGQTVFLCCEGCNEELQKNPEKYLNKLKK